MGSVGKIQVRLAYAKIAGHGLVYIVLVRALQAAAHAGMTDKMDHRHALQPQRPGGQERKGRVEAVPTDTRGSIEEDDGAAGLIVQCISFAPIAPVAKSANQPLGYAQPFGLAARGGWAKQENPLCLFLYFSSRDLRYASERRRMARTNPWPLCWCPRQISGIMVP